MLSGNHGAAAKSANKLHWGPRYLCQTPKSVKTVSVMNRISIYLKVLKFSSRFRYYIARNSRSDISVNGVFPHKSVRLESTCRRNTDSRVSKSGLTGFVVANVAPLRSQRLRLPLRYYAWLVSAPAPCILEVFAVPVELRNCAVQDEIL